MRVCVEVCARESKKERERKGGGDTKGRNRVERKGERHSKEVWEQEGVVAGDTVQTDKHNSFFLLQLPAAVPACLKQPGVEVQATEKGSCLLAEVRQAGRQAEGKPVDVFKSLLI